MSRYYKTEAIIIKRINFGEADRILTILTKNYGKIRVKAPGVRKITSRRSSHIELLNLSLLTLYRSFRISMPIVTEAQTQEEFLPIKNNLQKIGLAYYICELIDRLCADNQENKKVFFLAKDALYELANDSGGLSLIDNFEKEFLIALGFLPRVHQLKDKASFIENILERKLTTKRLLPLFIY